MAGLFFQDDPGAEMYCDLPQTVLAPVLVDEVHPVPSEDQLPGQELTEAGPGRQGHEPATNQHLQEENRMLPSVTSRTSSPQTGRVERLLLDEAPVAVLRQGSCLQPPEDTGQVEDVVGQIVAVMPHDVKQTDPGDDV
ncbi:hypothetical protein INR49_007092 [Caranx melampygus]|nr:hypothetical protein INR49_007092 [Caranx melampygus]